MIRGFSLLHSQRSWSLLHSCGMLRQRPSCLVSVKCLSKAKGGGVGSGNSGSEGKYSTTVLLPHTTFDQRANSLKREPEIQQWWKENRIYEHTLEHNTGAEFVLHDGPPYANGDLHLGHALNKVLKDIVNKYHILRGEKVRYVPGWDVHGLPIELKVLQSMKATQRNSLTPIALRKLAGDFAKKSMLKQLESFQRYGVWGDWEHPYTTMDPEYEAAQIKVFGAMLAKGHIYRGKKPVHWSPSSRTALAEAELEYPDGHVSRSIYVAFEVIRPSPALGALLQTKTKQSTTLTPTPTIDTKDVRVGIWTTTPWTIPSNLAIAVNKDLMYCIASHPSILKGSKLIVAKDLVKTVGSKFGLTEEDNFIVEHEILGSDLVGSVYQHPFLDRQSEIVIGGDYITTESGTGLVHTAPGHGMEDYITGLKYHLPLLSPVDDEGRFTNELDERFVGLDVLGSGNDAVIAALEGANALLKEEKYAHKYPYDWRTKKPTIFRATEQWFASVSNFRENALKAIETIQFIPSVGKNRIRAMIESRGDWCISRQRAWGVPIPVFYHKITKEPLVNADTIQHIQELIRKGGSNVWWEKTVEELLPPGPWREQANDYVKGTDTMDVWFDSGTSWSGVLQQRGMQYPANMYLEGSDQHRGWFQSSLLTSIAVEGKAPFQTVLTHGFLLDEKGFKMSKSLGNVMDPVVIINGGSDQRLKPAYGADTLRLWAASVDYTNDMCVGDNIIKQTSDTLRKLRNTFRFLVGSLSDFTPPSFPPLSSLGDLVSFEDLPSIDQYMLGKLTKLVEEVEQYYQQYQFARVISAISVFANIEVSAFYLDICKDRLYTSHQRDFRRRSCQTVIFYMLHQLATMVAPILPHLAEDLWQHLPYYKKQQHKSIFHHGWISAEERFSASTSIATKWNAVRAIKYEVYKCIESARQQKVIGASQESQVVVFVANEALRNELIAVQGDEEGLLPKPTCTNNVDDLRFVWMVSQVHFVNSQEEVQRQCPQYHAMTTLSSENGVASQIAVGVKAADGAKCQRCWYYSRNVGNSHSHPDLCLRCADVVQHGF